MTLETIGVGLRSNDVDSKIGIRKKNVQYSLHLKM